MLCLDLVGGQAFRAEEPQFFGLVRRRPPAHDSPPAQLSDGLAIPAEMPPDDRWFTLSSSHPQVAMLSAEVPMRFGLLGSVVQLAPGSEGDLLWQADLLDKCGDDWEIEIRPTDLLRSLFAATPAMEDLYPVLVELVLAYRYRGIPGFVDAKATARRLIELGVTSEVVHYLYAKPIFIARDSKRPPRSLVFHEIENGFEY